MTIYPDDVMDICREQAKVLIAEHEAKEFYGLKICVRPQKGSDFVNTEDVIWTLEGKRFDGPNVSLDTPSLSNLILVLELTHSALGLFISTDTSIQTYRNLDDFRDALTGIRERRSKINKNFRLGGCPDFETPMLQALNNLKSHHGRLRLLQEVQDHESLK
jgi:hypothetical protein